jgi:hypothetical protein
MMRNEPGDVQEIASCLAIMKPDFHLYEQWLGMMESGNYKFGYGVLRSADNEYDPFGLMVETFFPEWAWDDDEEAWAFEKSALFVSPRRIGEWLGISLTEQVVSAGMLDVIERFAQAVTATGDAARGFNAVVELLRAGATRVAQERQRWEAVQRQRPIRDIYRDERPLFYDDSSRSDRILGRR